MCPMCARNFRCKSFYAKSTTTMGVDLACGCPFALVLSPDGEQSRVHLDVEKTCVVICTKECMKRLRVNIVEKDAVEFI